MESKNLVKRAEPVYKQIAAHFRELIENGTLLAGDPIESTFELAKKFNVANQTAQNALKEMNRSGLVVRIPGKGTFVSNSLHSNTVAIVSGRSLYAESDTEIYSKMAIEAINYLNGKNFNSKVYTPAVEAEEANVIAKLDQDIRYGKIKFVLVLVHTPAFVEWLENSCTVPWIHAMQSQQSIHSYNELISLGIPFLEERGYRKVSLLYSKSSPDSINIVNHAMKQYDGNMEFNSMVTFRNYPEEAMKIIMEKEDSFHPDEALFVLDDNLCRGAVIGLLVRGLLFPEHIGLLTHANAGINILSPVSLSKIENNPIATMINNIDNCIARLNGDAVSEVKKHIRIVSGESCRYINYQGDSKK